MCHYFAVGQVVTLSRTIFVRFEVVQTFTVVLQMPAVGGAPQYRIRGDNNGQERVVKQHDIVAVERSS